MPSITKTINHQNTTPLFKEPLQIKQPKQENFKWSHTKIGIAAGGILSTFGLVCLPHYLKKIPAQITSPTSPVPAFLTVIGYLASLYFIHSYINSEIKKGNKVPDYAKNISNATGMKYLKFKLICNELDRLQAQSKQNNFNISDYQKRFDSHLETLLRFEDCQAPLDIELHGKTLRAYVSFILNFQPETAKKIADLCRKHLSDNTFPGLNGYFQDIIEMEGLKANVCEECSTGKEKVTKANISTKTIQENNTLEDPSLKNLQDIVIRFGKISQKSDYQMQFTKEGFDEIFDLTQKLHSLGNLNELLGKLDGKFAIIFTPFILDLSAILEKILYNPLLLKQRYSDDSYVQKFKTAFIALSNISRYSALQIASAYLVIKPTKDDYETASYQDIIMESLMESDDLAIEFAMLCSEGSDEHQKIAQTIWKKVSITTEGSEKYLMGCSKTNNDFCQNKLRDYVILHDSFGIPLIKSCADHLFEKDSAFVCGGNEAIVLKALRDFRTKDEQTKKFLLPIAQQTIESFRQAKGIRTSDLHWELCHSIKTYLKDSEARVGSHDAVHLIEILFDIYFHIKDFKNMKSLLNDCFATSEIEYFYTEAVNILLKSSDKRWKDIVNCTYDDNSPAEQNRLTG